jgi:hypothetical protein
MSSVSLLIDLQRFRNSNNTQKTQFSFNYGNIQSPSRNATGDLTAIRQLIVSPRSKVKFVQIQNMTRSLYEGHLTKTQAEKLKSEIDFLKKNVGFYLTSGTKLNGHGATDLVFNGCIGFDYDFRFKGGDLIAKALKETLKQFSFIPLLHLSSGGYGLKGLFLTDLKECDNELYSFAERKVFEFLASKGITFNYDKHAYGKTCYFAYDENAYLNANAQPFSIDLAEYQAECEAKKVVQNHSKSTLETDNEEIEQAVQYLINNNINVANGYDEYVSFTAACINTFGTEGGDIAYQILENSESFNLSNFKKNFDYNVKSLSEPFVGGKATERTILYHARENGFKYQQTAVSGQLDEYEFDNLDLFIVDRNTALQHIKKDTSRKIIVCEESYIETVRKELAANRFDGKTFEGGTGVCSYNELSKVLKLDYLKFTHLYVFGAENFNGNRYIFSANQVETIAKQSQTVLFADTPTYLNIACRIITIDRHTFNSKLVYSEKPRATFVELVKKYSANDVLFLDTHESINKQLKGYEKINRSELYAADHKKTLFVLYDDKVAMLPEAFSQFENVVFIAKQENKPPVSMSTYCTGNAKKTKHALGLLDNNAYSDGIERTFIEAVKNLKYAIRKNNGVWERCPNTEGVLETEHQIKLLLSNTDELQKYLNRFSVATNHTAVISETTDTIGDDIEQTKKDLATEKKTEYFAFLDDVEKEGITSQKELNGYVMYRSKMGRGAKVAFNRLKTLSKVNDEFSTCFEAVKKSYSDWTKTKGRFFAAKTIKNKTKLGNSLRTFRDTAGDDLYTKPELIEMARAMLMMVDGTDKEVWTQLKRTCYLPSRTRRRNKKVTRFYEVAFLE